MGYAEKGLFATFLLPLLFFAAASLDPYEVTNSDYLKFVQLTGHPAPEYWVNGRYPAGMEDDPVVLVTWHDAVSYCRWVERRLPTVDEWMGTCKAGKIKKKGDVWEWTSTDIVIGDETYKALCGPMDFCDCSHRYLPEWKNKVKGFRCIGSSPFLTRLPLLFHQDVFS